MNITCPNCYKVFRSPFGFHNVTAYLNDNYQQCPHCKKVVAMPNGNFKFDEFGMASLLSGPEFTPQVLSQLMQLTEQVKEQGLSIEEFKTKAAEITPAAIGLAAFAPKNAGELAAYLTVLLTLILALLNQEKPSITINNTYNTYAQVPSPSAQSTQPPPSIANQPQPSTGKPERNAMCPCGSGKKFKKCHGFYHPMHFIGPQE